MSDYLLYRDPQNRVVEAWSAWRLPFDNLKPAQKTFRDELRRDIAGLRATGVLYATYTSPQPAGRGDADLENVLFYNVGALSFRNAATRLLHFERRFGPVPDPPMALGFVPRHHVRYEVRDHVEAFVAGETIAEASVTCRNMGTPREDRAQLWRAFKMAMTGPCDHRYEESCTVQMTLSAPARRVLNLAAVVKPLTDAFVSALHVYHGAQLEAVVDRLCPLLECSPALARELLLDSRTAALGPRAIPNLFRDSLQWSPADDRIVAGEVARKESHGDLIHVSGRLRLAI